MVQILGNRIVAPTAIFIRKRGDRTPQSGEAILWDPGLHCTPKRGVSDSVPRHHANYVFYPKVLAIPITTQREGKVPSHIPCAKTNIHRTF